MGVGLVSIVDEIVRVFPTSAEQTSNAHGTSQSVLQVELARHFSASTLGTWKRIFEKVVLLTCRDDILSQSSKLSVMRFLRVFLPVELARLVCLPKQQENDSDKSCR